ncbi:MAG: M1 family peptidase, partial [Maribacter sp.]|nr:M1 family peptidase [Maribacter sp.]
MLQRYLILLFLVVSSARLFSQHQNKVDFAHADIDVQIDPNLKVVEGEVTYKLKILNRVDSVFLDARNMDFTAVRLNNRRVNYN